MAAAEAKDRFGIGWRPEYAAGILLHADEIDIVEVVAENFLRNKQTAQSLRTLSAQVPVALHGVSLGLASLLPVEVKRLDAFARLFDIFTPDCWSEHFAFVRAGGHEIGHLAAAPRNDDTIEGTLANLARAKHVIGALPHMENIATLITPPCSNYGEWEWMEHILATSGGGLLLDLHNLFANCLNFGADPFATLAALPLERVRVVHLSGGKWIKDPKIEGKLHLLDDHLHHVPDEVFELLSVLARLCPNPLTVLIERDGHYPPFEHMLAELRRARASVEQGRAAGHAKEAAYVCA